MNHDDKAALDEAGRLAALEPRFLAALQKKDAGALDEAEDELRAVIRAEPRLAEPHLELARLLLDTDRVEEAEEHAREAIEHLAAGGAWVEEVPEHELTALAHAVLAEALRRRADEDDVIFGDPEVFRRLVAEARAHFAKAAELDPGDHYASYHAFFLGIEGPEGTKVQVGPALADDEDPGADA